MANLVKVFARVKRVLRDDGILVLNLGDSYAGGTGDGSSPVGERKHRAKDKERMKEMNYKKPFNLSSKDLVGIPWRVAFAL